MSQYGGPVLVSLDNRDSTVRLIQTYFNPRTFWDWTPEEISHAWDEVERFTPSLGLRDEKAKVKQRRRSLEVEAAYLLAWMEPGGRVLDDDLLRVFREWNPQMAVTGNLLTRAVGSLLNRKKLRSNGEDYWEGFHLPTAAELAIRGNRVARAGTWAVQFQGCLYLRTPQDTRFSRPARSSGFSTSLREKLPRSRSPAVTNSITENVTGDVNPDVNPSVGT